MSTTGGRSASAARSHICSRQCVEHTSDTEEFRRAHADMTDDELAAIASGATLHVVK